MPTIIEQAIQKLEWQNDKSIDSPTARTIATLEALGLLAFHIERIADALEAQKEGKVWAVK